MGDTDDVETAEAVALHDKLLAERPEGARHDSDICPICVDKASAGHTEIANPPSRIPPGSAGPDVSESQPTSPITEGGTDHPMSDNANSSSISQETHQALLQKAVTDATSATDKALETKTAEATQLKADLDAAKAELETVKSDNARLNGELDTAQVELKSAKDKAEAAEADLAKEKEGREKADLASKRAEQVKNLGLFGDEYVAEKASSWASIDQAGWDERIEEWSKLKPADGKTTAGGGSTDTAMAGSSGTLTKTPAGDEASEQKPNARRAALGLS